MGNRQRLAEALLLDSPLPLAQAAPSESHRPLAQLQPRDRRPLVVPVHLELRNHQILRRSDSPHNLVNSHLLLDSHLNLDSNRQHSGSLLNSEPSLLRSDNLHSLHSNRQHSDNLHSLHSNLQRSGSLLKPGSSSLRSASLHHLAAQVGPLRLSASLHSPLQILLPSEDRHRLRDNRNRRLEVVGNLRALESLAPKVLRETNSKHQVPQHSVVQPTAQLVNP